MNSIHPLEAYRVKKGITQGALAKELGCSDSFLSRILAGERRVTAEYAVRWSRITGLTKRILCPSVFGE